MQPPHAPDDHEIAYVAGWGEDGALEQVQAAAQLVDQLARRIEQTLLDSAEESEPASAAAA